MANESAMYAVERIESLILTIRGQRVMLDSDLAKIYGVTTKQLNQQFRRNLERFPSDFAFRLTNQELTQMRSQIVTASYGGRRYLPYAFTDYGAIMAANVLNSPRATQMSVFVVRAFVKMRAALSDNRELARKLSALERELKGRLDVHEAAIVTILQRIMDIIDPPALPVLPQKDIGFHVKESRRRYVASRRRNHALRS